MGSSTTACIWVFLCGKGLLDENIIRFLKVKRPDTIKVIHQLIIWDALMVDWENELILL